jgi:3-deoxy-D-manno-octulosonic-acid transferase
MGMLGKVYRYGQAAYIGGGFGKGIHNTLEAAVYGIPVYFGPKNQKFIEAGALQAAGLAFEITTYAALGTYWEKHLDAAWRLQLKRNATSWFDNQAGASKRIMAQVEALLREA